MSARPPAGDYLRTQLIPYLGNKRTLLPALGSVFRELAQDRKDIRFLDPFAGSGSVSRLARTLGFRVEANDWEHYSYVLNDCWLALGAEDLDRAFGSAEGLRRELEELNALHPHAPGFRETTQGEPYMARWYAPRSTAEPVLGRERLFYTAENARFIDSVRATIEERYPERDPRSPGGIRRRIFLAALVLEAAVHANTSGVFKAYHRGFGGHGGDALKRILARMELEAPCLPDLPACGVSRMDASAFASRRPADIVYLDPPYNQHQYGSNYHILNTIVRWDRKPVPLDIGSDGELERKAGIPDEWKRTSSPFCRKREAAEAMR